jgi:arginyl-tRNA synthetase
LAKRLAKEPWIATAEVTGSGYITVTVTPEALAAVAGRTAEAGPASARGDALRGMTLEAPPPVDLLAAADLAEARTALAAELTVRLAAAAGATVAVGGDRPGRSENAGRSENKGELAAAVAFAGADSVRFSLARAVPGRRIAIDKEKIARRVPENPAYAVMYAHARAASGVRWAAALGEGRPRPQCLPADPAGLALLDGLSWLPERVAIAARRGRPDEFARYLEELASRTLVALSRGSARAPAHEKLALAAAARAGLAAGLGLLGVSAPDRL